MKVMSNKRNELEHKLRKRRGKKSVHNRRYRNKLNIRLKVTNDSYDVLVIATMSAGKSTLINAILGRELLHSANEATTACLTSTEYHEQASFYSGACYSDEGQQIDSESLVLKDKVRSWNADSQVNHIKLYGEIYGVSSSIQRLVLHDTPGPNNSQNERHSKIMHKALATIPSKAIIYVLNAGQLGVKDDHFLLKSLQNKIANNTLTKVIFVLNKIDLLDIERDENVTDYVEKTKIYLEQAGFVEPFIIPAIANAALYARKKLNGESLTRVESNRLKQSLEEFHSHKYTLINSAAVPNVIKTSAINEMLYIESIQNRLAVDTKDSEVLKLNQLIVYSGIRTLELFLSQKGTLMYE